MDALAMNVVLGILIVCLVTWLLYLHRRSRIHSVWKDGREYKLPSGSMGWPIVGETIQYYLSVKSTYHPRFFINERQRRYGDVFSSHLFGRRVMVSVDPEVNKFVMQNEPRLFQAYYPQSFLELIGKHSLLGLRGDLQRRIHGVVVNLLSQDKLCTHFTDNIQVFLLNAMSNWDGKKIKLEEECHQIILDLMAKQLLDLSPSKETEEIRRQFYNFSAAVLSVPIQIPGSRFAKGIQARNYLLKKIYDIMEERRKHPHVVHNDLLSKFLTEEPHLSDEFVAVTLLFLLFAGHETTSRNMVISIKYLTDCPQALEQLRDEHDRLLKAKGQGDQKITWDDFKSMKFTQCVINEVLRLANVAPFLQREALQDVYIKDYHIPKGSTVLVFLAGVHTDEKHYCDSLNFNPWRWEACHKDASNKIEFLPFGGGARLCPGANLARLELSLFLHHFVTKFRWDMLKDDKISFFPFPYFLNGFPIKIYTRM